MRDEPRGNSVAKTLRTKAVATCHLAALFVLIIIASNHRDQLQIKAKPKPNRYHVNN